MAKQAVNIGSSPNDGTGDSVRVAMDKINDNATELYSFLGDGSSLALSGDATISNSVVTISNDAVNYEKIDPEFSTASTLTAGATVDIDFDSAQVFNLTPDQTTVLNITNPKIGMTKCIILTGAGGSYTISFTVGGASGTFNKISGDYDDTSAAKNFIQIVCVSATEFWYSISQIA